MLKISTLGCLTAPTADTDPLRYSGLASDLMASRPPVLSLLPLIRFINPRAPLDTPTTRDPTGGEERGGTENEGTCTTLIMKRRVVCALANHGCNASQTRASDWPPTRASSTSIASSEESTAAARTLEEASTSGLQCFGGRLNTAKSCL